MPRTRALVLLAVLAGASLTGCKVPDGLASGSPAGAQPAGTAAAPPIAPGDAKAKTQVRREQFANDLFRPQLHAVTDNLNEQKSDKAPDQWKPPLVSGGC